MGQRKMPRVEKAALCSTSLAWSLRTQVSHCNRIERQRILSASVSVLKRTIPSFFASSKSTLAQILANPTILII
ncbi:hypothetical protein [Desmospora activa]|uniref:hypothetical protein n=1 Tax=Desmospora activa TaxID=500615 RepID=UPI0011B2019A|nr:hypothetical protein [Desmospora activa]